MSVDREALGRALDGARGGGVAEVGRARVDVVEADRLGVRVRKVAVSHDPPVDVAEEARRLSEGLRALPERLEPVEVAPSLGGARLRTRPDDLRRREFFEVEVTPGETAVGRTRLAGDPPEREPADFTLTRDQLGDLIDEL